MDEEIISKLKKLSNELKNTSLLTSSFVWFLF